MTSKIIVAIVAIAATVLSLAAPVAVEAQPADPVVFACSEAADTAVWRFYTAVSLPPLVYDFDARSNLPTDKVSLHVEQYAGDWNTRLSIPAGDLDPYATGSTRLQAGQWTDVDVQCEGEGEVILTVTRRRPVSLRSVYDPTAPSEPTGTFTGTCRIETNEDSFAWGGGSRYFNVALEEHMDLVAYATNPDTYIRLGAVAVEWRRNRTTQGTFIAYTGLRRGSLHTTGTVSDYATDLDPALIGRIDLSCRGLKEDEVTVRVTRREPVSLRRIASD